METLTDIAIFATFMTALFVYASLTARWFVSWDLKRRARRRR